MELKEHLKLAFQTEVQLHVMENEVLPKWKQANTNMQFFKNQNNAAIKQKKNAVCKTVMTPAEIKNSVTQEASSQYYAKYQRLVNSHPQLWENDERRAEFFDEKFQSTKNPAYNRHQDVETARKELERRKKFKYNIFEYIFGGMFKGLLVALIPAIALFGAYFGTGKQFIALLIIALSITGGCALLGILISAPNCKNDKRINQEWMEAYEIYIQKMTAYNADLEKSVKTLEKERDEYIEKQTKIRLEKRDKDLENFYANTKKEASQLEEYGKQIDQCIEYTSVWVKAIEGNIAITKEVLHKFYEAGFDGGKVHERYRGLIPVGMFYEYVDTERCDTLAGHGGAYNMYEDDCRAARIEQKLDNINNNMFYIGKELKSAISNASSAIQGSMYFMGNQLSSNISGLQNGIEGVRSISSGTNRLMESLSERGISVHGTLELK